MEKLCTASFYPSFDAHDLIKDAMQQIIYSVLGIVKVFEDPYNPYSLYYQANSFFERVIQHRINLHLPKILYILGSKRDAIWQYLFENALYVASNVKRSTLPVYAFA